MSAMAALMTGAQSLSPSFLATGSSLVGIRMSFGSG